MPTWRFYKYRLADDHWQLIGVQSGPDAYMFMIPPNEADIITVEETYGQGYDGYAIWKLP